MHILAKFGRFWAKNPNFLGVSKRFGTNITENHQDNLSALFFGQALDQMGQNANIWPKMPVFGQIWPFLGQKSIFVRGWSKTLGNFGLVKSSEDWTVQNLSRDEPLHPQVSPPRLCQSHQSAREIVHYTILRCGLHRFTPKGGVSLPLTVSFFS